MDLAPLERNPKSEAKRESLREDLADTKAGEDQEALGRIDAFSKAVEKGSPKTAAAIGVDLKEVKAAFLKAATGTSRDAHGGKSCSRPATVSIDIETRGMRGKVGTA